MDFFKKHKILTIFLIILTFYIYYNFTRTVSVNKLVDKNSSQYVNDLYMSDGRIYNNYLTDQQKKMYDFFLENVQAHTKAVNIKLDDFQCTDVNDCIDLLFVAGDAIIVDHPELMSYSGWSALYDESTLKLKFDYAVSFTFLEEISEARIKRIIDDIKRDTEHMSDKQKIKYVYNWIGTNTNYDTVFTEASKNQSIFNVFMAKEAVCAGFAKASQIIFQNIGIESYGVTGVTSGNHMWNIVEYEGKYYFFDSTVATSLYKTSSHYYDGLKQETMNDYIIDYPNWYPEIEEVGIFS